MSSQKQIDRSGSLRSDAALRVLRPPLAHCQDLLQHLVLLQVQNTPVGATMFVVVTSFHMVQISAYSSLGESHDQGGLWGSGWQAHRKSRLYVLLASVPFGVCRDVQLFSILNRDHCF